MKIMKKALILLVCLAAWIARGVFDEIFMMNGHIHVINHSQDDVRITLEFPSGERREIDLKKNGSTDLEVSNTGEGSITVLAGDKITDRVGYVTSLNRPIILCISEEDVSFSQIYK